MHRQSRYLLFAISLLCAAVFVRLGFWQLSRLRQRRANNALAEQARSRPPLRLNTGELPANSLLAGRRVIAKGIYDPAHQIVLRGHVYLEAPGVEVVTPLRLTGTTKAIMVNRGFVASPDAMTTDLDSLNEPGVVEVRGIALPLPTSSDSGKPLTHLGRETWRRLDLPALRARLPYPVIDVYILQSPDSALPRHPIRLEPPPLDNGPHLSYAIQWFSFATIAVVGGWLFLWRGKTE